LEKTEKYHEKGIDTIKDCLHPFAIGLREEACNHSYERYKKEEGEYHL
jgi:hypothetical protein